MKLPIYQIDAFANKSFEGNPAAVVPLVQWLSDDVMQAIAEENNLAETAFLVREGENFRIRWFTPTTEVDLCGHATLASAFVLFTILGYEGEVITFESLSGLLSVTKKGDMFSLNFPAQVPQPCEVPGALVEGLGKAPSQCLSCVDYIVVFDHEDDIAQMEPNMQALSELGLRGVIVTAPSSNYDFVVRCFAPNAGIPEDPVTGSAYTQLAPFWAERLGKNSFHAKQISPRGGEVMCELVEDRVLISGNVVMYLEGHINL